MPRFTGAGAAFGPGRGPVSALHAGALTRHGRSARLAPSSRRCNYSGSLLAASLPTAGSTGLAIWFYNPWLSGLAFYGRPFGCPFVPALRQDFRGRCVIQAPESVPGRTATGFRLIFRPKPLVILKPCDPVVERTFPAFRDLLRHPGLLVLSLRPRLF
jgi:hypothetical protein